MIFDSQAASERHCQSKIASTPALGCQIYNNKGAIVQTLSDDRLLAMHHGRPRDKAQRDHWQRAMIPPRRGFALRSLLLASVIMRTGLAEEIDYGKTLQSVAQDIADLKRDFPQLQDFSPAVNGASINYGYHTHKAEHRGGWTAQVPNPDDDGVWFYIDVHAPDSTAQIHTQPITLPLCLGEKRVSFLILEGKNTKPVGGAIFSVLASHGVQKCSK
jgi:hypothetical protein